MQFDYFFKIGMPVAQVEFKTFGHSNMITLFERIGGKQVDSIFTWEFPTFVNSNLLKEIIHNTCFVCGGLMKNHTDYKYGKDKPIRMRKYIHCGHSHT